MFKRFTSAMIKLGFVKAMEYGINPISLFI